MIDQPMGMVNLVSAATPGIDQFGANAVILMLLDFAKRWKAIPWIDEHTKQVNRLVGYILAGAIGLGIGWTFDESHHTLMITGLDPVTILGNLTTNIWFIIRSIAMQQWMYDSRVVPSIGPALPRPLKEDK